MNHRIQHDGGSSSSTSISSKRDSTDDDRAIALILSEEYANLDGAVARRLTNLSSVPHVPRINTYIPNFSDASLDHHRLLQRISAYGLYEVKVSGDGNCQFRALSDQLYRSPDYHKHVRKEVIKQLKEFRSLYEGYVPMKFKHYYKKMAKSGEWGDHVTLQAAADRFGAKICLLTSFRDTCFIEIVPQQQTPQRGFRHRPLIFRICPSPGPESQVLLWSCCRNDDVCSLPTELWLSFWCEVHYNSIYNLGDVQTRRKPRKRHWLL